MVRVGVTGATGFIGGALVPELAARGWELRLIDNGTGPMRVAHREWPSVHGSFESAEGLHLLSDSDVVLHLGAVSGVIACANDPAGSARVNVAGTQALADMCRERRIPLAFASSMAVVGSPERLPVTEGTPPGPTHEYARQKAEGERIVHALAVPGAVASAVLRMSNVYGSYLVGTQTIAKGNVLTLFLEQARRGVLTVNAPGTQRRDFIHVHDVVAHWTAVVDWLRAHGSNPTGPVFNVASGEGYSVLEIAEKVRTAWTGAYGRGDDLRVEVVRNPREGVELVDPDFRVSRRATERALGVGCRWTVDKFLRRELAR